MLPSLTARRRSVEAAFKLETRQQRILLLLSPTFSVLLFRKRSFYVPLIIALGLNIFQQFSGINAIMFNAETIFANSGFKNSALAMIILGGVNVLATVLSVAVIDK